MGATVDYSKAIAKITALGAALHKPISDVLDSTARTVAINLARAAVPFGTGENAKVSGEKAVTRDIYRVYGNAGGAYAVIDPGLKRGFWAKFKAGEFDQAQAIAEGAGVRIEDFDDGAAHRRARNSRGRVTQSKPSFYIIHPSERRKLERYVEKEKRAVGFAKGGFADIARAIGSAPRGLREEGDITAAWITSKGRGYGAAFHTGDGENAAVRITNRVPYADQALEGSALSRAISIGLNRMRENLEIAVNRAARKINSESSS